MLVLLQRENENVREKFREKVRDRERETDRRTEMGRERQRYTLGTNIERRERDR